MGGGGSEAASILLEKSVLNFFCLVYCTLRFCWAYFSTLSLPIVHC